MAHFLRGEVINKNGEYVHIFIEHGTFVPNVRCSTFKSSETFTTVLGPDGYFCYTSLIQATSRQVSTGVRPFVTT